MLNQWLMRRMALDLGVTAKRETFEPYPQAWAQMLAQHVQAREEGIGPPCRPSEWDRRQDIAARPKAEP